MKKMFKTLVIIVLIAAGTIIALSAFLLISAFIQSKKPVVAPDYQSSVQTGGPWRQSSSKTALMKLLISKQTLKALLRNMRFGIQESWKAHRGPFL